jgi:hypothetical protein
MRHRRDRPLHRGERFRSRGHPDNIGASRGAPNDKTRHRRTDVEHSFGGPLGTLIAGLGMGAYYVGLTWINILLGVVLTPFFIIPLTWLQDAVMKRRAASK